MKHLKILCEQTGVRLSIKWYLSYLNQAEIDLLMRAEEKSQSYQLNLLRAFSLSILFQLQHAEFIFGEAQWEAFIAKCQYFAANAADSYHLKMALCKADELIEAAGITEEVRHKIWDEVKRQSLLSDPQVKQYELARQACLKSLAILNNLEDQVEGLVNEYDHVNERKPAAPTSFSLFQADSREFSIPLKSYDPQFQKERLSRKNIFHRIWREKNARVVYHSLAEELLQTPAVKKLTKSIDQAKDFLKHRSTKIIDKAKNSHQSMTRHTSLLIEHRTQALLAHADRVEKIALQLAMVIHSLQPYVNTQPIALFNFMMEAKAMQELLSSDSKASSCDLQGKLLAMEVYRCHFESSMHSIWSTLSFNRQQLNLQRQLHSELQTSIANLVAPICSFDDKNTSVLPEKVKQLQTISDKLFIHQEPIHQAQEKIHQIKNIL